MQATTLALDDLCSINEDGSVELREDMQSAKEFWMLILMLADADGAASVQFYPNRGDDCLSLTIDGVEYFVKPPDERLRTWLFRAGCDLIAGNAERGRMWRWIARTFFRRHSGLVTVDIERRQFTWRGTVGSAGVMFQPVVSPAAN